MSVIPTAGPTAQTQIVQEGERTQARSEAPQGLGNAASTIAETTTAEIKPSFLKKAALFIYNPIKKAALLVASPFIYLGGKIADALLFLPKKLLNFVVYLFTLSIPKQIKRIKQEIETNAFSIEKVKNRMEKMDGNQEEFFDALLTSKLLSPKDEVFLWNEFKSKCNFSITILDELIKHTATLEDDRARVITSIKLTRQEVLYLLDHSKYIFNGISSRKIGEIFYAFLEKLPLCDQINQVIQFRKILDEIQLSLVVNERMDQIKNTKQKKLLLLGVADSLTTSLLKNIMSNYFPLKIQNQIYYHVGQLEHLYRGYLNIRLTDNYLIELGLNSSNNSYFKIAIYQVLSSGALDSLRNTLHESHLEDLRDDIIS
jgi:hypothetical protein